MIRSLLAGAIDYAGLFPPAGLAMPDAVRCYAAYRDGPDAWALGRFVLPASRLDELAAAARALATAAPSRAPSPWQLSALVAGDGASDFAAIRGFNARHQAGTSGWSAVVDMVEARADGTDAVETLAKHRDPGIATFVEVPASDVAPPLIIALAAHRLAAKVRTGGVTPEQFPAAHAVAGFIAECVRLRVPFKATAGLHHPVRGEFPLTYEPDATRGTMFGFLNVLVASAAAHAGAPLDTLVEVLEERDMEAFSVTDGTLAWRDHRFAAADVEAMRETVARSFGSCSFEEPLADLRSLGLLPPHP